MPLQVWDCILYGARDAKAVELVEDLVGEAAATKGTTVPA